MNFRKKPKITKPYFDTKEEAQQVADKYNRQLFRYRCLMVAQLISFLVIMFGIITWVYGYKTINMDALVIGMAIACIGVFSLITLDILRNLAKPYDPEDYDDE